MNLSERVQSIKFAFESKDERYKEVEELAIDIFNLEERSKALAKAFDLPEGWASKCNQPFVFQAVLTDPEDSDNYSTCGGVIVAPNKAHALEESHEIVDQDYPNLNLILMDVHQISLTSILDAMGT